MPRSMRCQLARLERDERTIESRFAMRIQSPGSSLITQLDFQVSQRKRWGAYEQS